MYDLTVPEIFVLNATISNILPPCFHMVYVILETAYVSPQALSIANTLGKSQNYDVIIYSYSIY